MVEVVGEGLPRAKCWRKVGQAAAEGMAARVNDLRVGQDEMDERHEHPVVRQLVDEQWPIGPALHRRPPEIFFPQRPALFG
jgi:hypothetical protein